MKKLFFTIIIIFIIYCLGFLYFIYLINSNKKYSYPLNTKAEAIVVLTGGLGRIQKGIKLLTNEQAEKLLITGVGQNTYLKDIEHINDEFPINYIQNLKDKITLGYEANNTKGNAKEASEWLKLHQFKNIFLVTSDYHMPRSIIEFQTMMPEIKIFPVAVNTNYLSLKNIWKIYYKIFMEYNKYLIIKIDSKFYKKTL